MTNPTNPDTGPVLWWNDNAAAVVADGLFYAVRVGWSARFERDVFQLVNKKWGVVALEVANEDLAKSALTTLDDRYGKPEVDTLITEEDMDSMVNFNVPVKSH